MRTKSGSVRELIAGIRQAAEQEEYNPAEDLKTLQTQYKRLGKKDFGLMLDAMVEKYAAGEYAAIHAALVEKARNGDIEAIKMYRALGYGDWSNGSFCCSACSNYLLGKSKTK